jgi:trimethylamine:corrinoid methyltransferase-like protein
VVDRDFRRTWEAKGSLDVTERAHQRVEQIVAAYTPTPLSDEVTRELETIALRAAQAVGMGRLPERE